MYLTCRLDPKLSLLDTQLRNILKSSREESQCSSSGSDARRGGEERDESPTKAPAGTGTGRILPQIPGKAMYSPRRDREREGQLGEPLEEINEESHQSHGHNGTKVTYY